MYSLLVGLGHTFGTKAISNANRNCVGYRRPTGVPIRTGRKSDAADKSICS